MYQQRTSEATAQRGSQKDRVVVLVNLVPDLFVVQRIAFFDGNVHILYVAEIALDSGLLL